MDKDKSTRGGARKGAGNKKGSIRKQDKRKVFSLMLSDAERGRLIRLTGGRKMSDYIRNTLGIADELHNPSPKAPKPKG